VVTESMAGRKQELGVLTAENSVSSKMSDPQYGAFADSKNPKSRDRLHLWSSVKHRHRQRNADCSGSLSPPSISHWEFEHSTSHLIKEENIVIEGIITVGNAAFSSSPKPRGSMRIWNLKDFFWGSSKRGCSEKVNKRLPFSSYAKLYSSSSPDKEKRPSGEEKLGQKMKRSSGEEKLAHKKKMVSKTVYISSPNRKGVPVSAHELHYIANRAQAEELRRKTSLPYRQGVLACLRFPSPYAQGICY